MSNYTPTGGHHNGNLDITSITPLPICEGFHGTCTYREYEYTIICFSVLAVIINIFHLIVLNRMDNIRGTAYLSVLQVISMFDIFSAFAYIVKMSCYIHISLSYTPKWTGILKNILSDSVILSRYSILALACGERYIAVCKTFQYKTSSYTKRLKLWSVLVYLTVLGIMTSREVLSMDDMCVHPVIGVIAISDISTTLYLITILVPAAIATVLLMLVFKELRKMKKQSLTMNLNQLDRATKYIAIICAAFYVCFLPKVAAYFIKSFFKSDTVVTAMIVNGAGTVYGILNTLVYGWKNKQYRRQFGMLFKIPNSRVVSIYYVQANKSLNPKLSNTSTKSTHLL